MRRATAFLLRSAAVLLAVLIAAALLLVLETGWVLNTRTASFALKRFGKSYQPRWTQLRLRVRGALTKRIEFHAAELCLEDRRGALSACFPRLDLDATVRLGWSPLVSVLRLETLVIRSSRLKMDSTKAPPAEKKAAPKAKPGGSKTWLPAALTRMRIGVVDMDIPEIETVSSSGTTRVKARAAFDQARPEPLRAEAYVVSRGTGAAAEKRYSAKASVDSDLFREGRLTRLDARASARGDQLDARASARVQPDGSRLGFQLRASARLATRKIEAAVDGARDPQAYSAQGGLSIADASGALERMALESCRFDAPLDKGGRVDDARLRCEMSVEPRLFGPTRRAGKGFSGPLELDVDFKGKSKDKFEARLSTELRPSAKEARALARLEARLAGVRTNLPKSLKRGHDFSAGLEIGRFQDLVRLLAGTDWAIPAPLNALDGPIRLHAEMTGKGASPQLRYRLSTGLAGGRQSVKTLTTGTLSLRHAFDADRSVSDRTEVDLKDVALELPELEIGKTPSPSVDTRIKTGDPRRDAAVERKRRQLAAPAATKSSTDYLVHVFSSQPVRILSNLAKDPVPIALDLKAAPAGLSGKIEIRPFRMDVFRQEGRVDHVTITPEPGSPAMGLDGKVVYKKSGVTVNILLLGSTAKPKVSFESDPPMSQDEIVGILLFSKSPGELDADQQKSAGNASAAMASGALGLASLYLFAATPIESVGYDPNTSSYQVRFKLPGGATLKVGSDLQESRSLGLRKRIAKRLEIETELRREQREQRNAITTFLQWFMRY